MKKIVINDNQHILFRSGKHSILEPLTFNILIRNRIRELWMLDCLDISDYAFYIANIHIFYLQIALLSEIKQLRFFNDKKILRDE